VCAGYSSVGARVTCARKLWSIALLAVACTLRPRTLVKRAIEEWDVVIVGGGPAGLSAALLLGRCRRRVLVIDDGHPRNAASHAAHAVFTRDGEHPEALRQIARQQLAPYDVTLREETVANIQRRDGGGFELIVSNGERCRAKKVLLTTGLVDELPEVNGLSAIYGRSAFQCPYCDGWEVRDRRLAVLARSSSAAVEYALGLTTWSADIVLCTVGSARLSRADRAKLGLHDIRWRNEPVVALEHDEGQLQRIRFSDGSALARDALFVHTTSRARASFGLSLGCDLARDGSIKTDKLACAGEGLYVAGDAAREVHFVTVAAAEGLKAAFAINRELRTEQTQRSSMVRDARGTGAL
jgi:thioredoxin reductase